MIARRPQPIGRSPPVIPEAEPQARLSGTSISESNLARSRLEALLAYGSLRFGRDDGWRRRAAPQREHRLEALLAYGSLRFGRDDGWRRRAAPQREHRFGALLACGSHRSDRDDGWRGRAEPRGESGFTLIEVLVSLVLLALVLALLAGGVRFARGTWDAAARLDDLAGIDMAETFLRARLGEAMPLYEQVTGGTVRVAFHGTAETLSFVAAAPNGPAGAGLYRYALEVAPGAGPGRRVLAVKLAPYQAARSEPGTQWAPQRHELLRNVKSVAFRYFGRGEIKARPAWHSAWTRTDSMPNLVEMTVARGDSKGGLLSLVVALRLQTRAR